MMTPRTDIESEQSSTTKTKAQSLVTCARSPNLASALPLVFETNARALGAAIDELQHANADSDVKTLLRLAMMQTGRTTLWYQRLVNRWEDLDRPSLKPNSVSKKLVCLSNHTIDNLAPLITCFAAAVGVHLDVQLTAYDSVESEALDPLSSLYAASPDFVVVTLSQHWLNRHLGDQALVTHEALDRTVDMIRRIAGSLIDQSKAQILLTNFAPGSHAAPAGNICVERMLGRSAALAKLNCELNTLQSDRLTVLDLSSAVHIAGGADAYSTQNYLRAKMPYEQRAVLAMAREIAFGIASLCGKTHRALVTDLDNTLWGGVIGDLGSHGVVSSQDDPDGLGYFLLQSYMKSLKPLGVLLCIASKNSPEVQQVFQDNPDIALQTDDFSCIQIHWEPKSRSISQISADLGFGSEYMVFVDDNVFELTEALRLHPDLDVVLARSDPTETLRQLVESRFFHTLQLTDTDLSRHEQIASKRAGAELQAKFESYDDYLKAINIKIEVQPYVEQNRRRVLQMLQKSNQFNLTTRRHTEPDLEQLMADGATITAFSYTDQFGPQGVIAAVILVPDEDRLRIDSWVMSCRVLARTVEEAVCNWLLDKAGDRPVVGEFRSTQKNGIVKDLYDRLGFKLLNTDNDSDYQQWIFDRSSGDTPPTHFATLVETQKDTTNESS